MIYTTLNRIRVHGPCGAGWRTLLKSLNKTQADDEPLGFNEILKSNGIDDTLWCLRAEAQHNKFYQKLAVKFAQEVQHLMKDQRSLNALAVAQRYSEGYVSDEELEMAWSEAENAANDAVEESILDAARQGVESKVAVYAAEAATWTVDRCTAWTSAWAASARYAAMSALDTQVEPQAKAAAESKQTEILLKVLSKVEANPGEEIKPNTSESR